MLNRLYARLSAAALVGALGEALVRPLGAGPSPVPAHAVPVDALVDGLVHFALRSVSQEVPHVVAH